MSPGPGPGPARFEDTVGLVGRELKETPNIIPAYRVIWLYVQGGY